MAVGKAGAAGAGRQGVAGKQHGCECASGSQGAVVLSAVGRSGDARRARRTRSQTQLVGGDGQVVVDQRESVVVGIRAVGVAAGADRQAGCIHRHIAARGQTGVGDLVVGQDAAEAGRLGLRLTVVDHAGGIGSEAGRRRRDGQRADGRCTSRDGSHSRAHIADQRCGAIATHRHFPGTRTGNWRSQRKAEVVVGPIPEDVVDVARGGRRGHQCQICGDTTGQIGNRRQQGRAHQSAAVCHGIGHLDQRCPLRSDREIAGHQRQSVIARGDGSHRRAAVHQRLECACVAACILCAARQLHCGITGQADGVHHR